MRIAIASKEDNENSLVCEVSGRAPYYLIFEDGKLTEVIKNPFAMGGGGAGFSVARMIKDKNVDLVIAGRLGGNMLNMLEEYGIQHKEVIGKKVSDVVKEFM